MHYLQNVSSAYAGFYPQTPTGLGLWTPEIPYFVQPWRNPAGTHDYLQEETEIFLTGHDVAAHLQLVHI